MSAICIDANCYFHLATKWFGCSILSDVNSVAAVVIVDSSVTFTVFICIYEYLIWPLSAANAKRKREMKREKCY